MTEMRSESGNPQISALWPGRGGPSIDYISAPPSCDYCAKTKRGLVILGSTGSIGRSALDVASKIPDKFTIAGLACATNVELLAAQATQWLPPMLAVLDNDAREKLHGILPKDYKPEIVTGPRGYAEIASIDKADLVLGAQVGAAGLPGVLAAAFAGKVIALANKESLVLAGYILRDICSRTGASILPLDSEHYAVFQCVAGRGQTVGGIILTASGGPFRGMNADGLKKVKARDALKHPNWSMGSKITIDSATLMNKGLEIIEAMHLYGMSSSQVEVVIHPQSVVHSFARFADNSLLAQLAVPDMCLPVAGCLLWPHCEASFVPGLNIASLGNLSFSQPDYDNFPCLRLAMLAMSMPLPKAWHEFGVNPACIILNAANEAAVDLFLAGKCGFCDIPAIVGDALDELEPGMPLRQKKAASSAAQAALSIYSAIAELDAKCRKWARSWTAL